MRLRNVSELDSREWCVVDMDTGTILGTNVRLVRAGFLDEGMSDSEAWAAAESFGEEILTDRDD